MKQGEAGGTVWILANDEERGGRDGVGVANRASGGGVGSVFGGGVEFTELFEETEGALEGAFVGGFVAKQEVVLLNILGVQLAGERPSGEHSWQSKLRWARMRYHSAWAVLRTKSYKRESSAGW